VILVIALAALSIAGLRILRGAVLGDVAGGGWRVGAFTVVEGLIVVGMAIGLLLLWGIDPFDRTAATGLARLIPALVEAGLVVVIGIALWRSVADALARQPAEAEDAQDAGDGMGGEGSRLETVLPIMRGAALGAIGITTGMIALSALGVNITPLIASAGVVGLAIGFGSQKLVSDVISGAFYLYEDAFRIGEYVVTKNGKGTVERISLRSATLRHHNGPLYTIPFSEMGTIQNHSRDYVVMKFSFMVPDETDVEFVRKLIKKAGQELAKDPELEGKLIAPLKSQGAIAIQGRNFEIGCKFTARPGDQFVIRRKAYYILQKTLRDNNIELSAPSVTLAAEEKAFAPSMPPA
jgi:small-conductance mechanosensitive channel